MRARSTYAVLGAGAVLIAAGLLYGLQGADPLPMPETVRLPAATQRYRPAGEFRQGTRVVDAPVGKIAALAMDVMKHHVSEAE